MFCTCFDTLYEDNSSCHGLQMYDFEKRKVFQKMARYSHRSKYTAKKFAQLQARIKTLLLGDIYISERDIESVIRLHTRTMSLRFSVCVEKWHKRTLVGFS